MAKKTRPSVLSKNIRNHFYLDGVRKLRKYLIEQWLTERRTDEELFLALILFGMIDGGLGSPLFPRLLFMLTTADVSSNGLVTIRNPGVKESNLLDLSLPASAQVILSFFKRKNIAMRNKNEFLFFPNIKDIGKPPFDRLSEVAPLVRTTFPEI